MKLRLIKIDPEAFSADDIEELEVMVKGLLRKMPHDRVTDAQQQLVNNATGGMKIPGLF